MEFRMTAITAKDNPSIQLYRKLVRQRKARTQNQQFVLEGYRLVTDAVHFSRKLTHLFLTEAAWERYQEEFCSLEADLRETKRLLISNELAMELTETEHPRACLPFVRCRRNKFQSLQRERIWYSTSCKTLAIWECCCELLLQWAFPV